MQGLFICKNLVTNFLSQEGLFLEPMKLFWRIEKTQEIQDFNYCDLII